MRTLSIPIAVADDSDAGQVAAVTIPTAGSVNLSPGLYKVAAMGQPLLWRIGAVAVTNAVGSYLAAGDQELVVIPGDKGGPAVALHFINSTDASADGQINIVKAHLFEIPGAYPEEYNTPA